MGRFESLRDRLPSLYRPDADEAVEPLFPLAPDDLVEVLTADGAATFFVSARAEGTLLVNFDEPQRIIALRVAAGRAPGSGYVLELYPFVEPTVLASKPAVVAGAVDGFAALRQPFEQRRFGLQLKRRSLLTSWLEGVAGALEEANGDAADVMQSHWFRFADRALYSPFFLRGRELHEPPQGVPKPSDADVLDFPYVLDLGRLGSMLSLPPWQQPVGTGTVESVEAYRQRIARIVALYVAGLGTVDALRRMTEAQLPVDLDAPLVARDRPFDIEELAPLETVQLPVLMPGLPTDLVGPLMHWTLSNDGLTSALPTVTLEAATAEALNSVDGAPPQAAAAAAPLLEVFDPAAERPALGLAYRDAIPPGQTLRLRPAYASWLGTGTGIEVARSEPGPAPADPTAPGPWSPAEGAPAGVVAALLQTGDRALWAGLNDAGTFTLWRLDTSGWSKVHDDAGAVLALAEDGNDLVAGTTNGLLRLARFPEEGAPADAQREPSPDGRAVHALHRSADGTLWQGTSKGLGKLGEGDAFQPFVLTGDLETSLLTVAEDSSGALYAGGELGLFQYQADFDRWYWYSGEQATDQLAEWEELDPSAAGADRNFPTDAKVFLPAVTCVLRARDGTLWIGTEAGLARYLARAERGALAYRTVLEAFPDLVPGRVDAIVEDERGLLWFATDRGVLRFDGRDFLQFRAEGGWAELGRADSLYDGPEPRPRGSWRYRRAGAEWQRFGEELATPDWVAFGAEPRTTGEAVIHALVFTDGVAAELLDDTGAATSIEPDRFVMRYKLPGYERVLDGGLAAVPRLEPGESSWRYLSLEPKDAPAVPGPAWTIEGRFVAGALEPPADAEPDPGRFDETAPDADAGAFGAAVFAFPPAARVAFEWTPRRPLRVLARLGTAPGGDAIEPAVVDRVWQGLQQVRPAGVEVALAVDGTIVRQGSQ